MTGGLLEQAVNTRLDQNDHDHEADHARDRKVERKPWVPHCTAPALAPDHRAEISKGKRPCLQFSRQRVGTARSVSWYGVAPSALPHRRPVMLSPAGSNWLGQSVAALPLLASALC